jgi:hypothetical protein
MLPSLLAQAKYDDIEHSLAPHQDEADAAIQQNRDAAKADAAAAVEASRAADRVFLDAAANLSRYQLLGLLTCAIVYEVRQLPSDPPRFNDSVIFNNWHRMIYIFSGILDAKIGETIKGTERPDSQMDVVVKDKVGQRWYTILAAYHGTASKGLQSVVASLATSAVESCLHIAIGGNAKHFAGRVVQYMRSDFRARETVGDFVLGVARVDGGKYVSMAGYSSHNVVPFCSGSGDRFNVTPVEFAPNSPVALVASADNRVQLLLTIKDAALPAADPLARLMARAMARVRATMMPLVDELLADEGEGGGRAFVLTPPGGADGFTLADLLRKLDGVLGRVAPLGELKVSRMDQDDARTAAHGAFPVDRDASPTIYRLVDLLADVWYLEREIPRDGWKAPTALAKLEELPTRGAGAVGAGEGADADADPDEYDD